jgi:hypothetical protein
MSYVTGSAKGVYLLPPPGAKWLGVPVIIAAEEREKVGLLWLL